MNQFMVNTEAIGGSLGLTALVSAVPLVTFFVMLLFVKARAHTSGAAALLAALLIAIFGMSMPVDAAISSAFRGGLFGLLPIVWVIMMAIWFYQVTVASGRFEDLRRTFDALGNGDIRIQAILIAFCFGGLLEALAGFGAPVAITATMILALGVKPLKAATTVLLANTAPVAFGAVAIPITTAGNVGGRTVEQTENIAAIVGHQAPFFAFLVPFILLFILDGTRGMREAAPAAAVIGGAFAIAQWWASNFFAYQLTDIVACLVSLGAAFAFLRVWQPKGVAAMRKRLDIPEREDDGEVLTKNRVWMAMMPYAVVTVIFGLANLGETIPGILDKPKISFAWPLLTDRLVSATGSVIDTSYTFKIINNPGTLLLISGIIVAVVYGIFNHNGKFRVNASDVVGELTSTAYKMRWTALTIVMVLALAYVMNYSGQTVAMGAYVASLGAVYGFLAPVLGWVGTAITGSDTSANALFANLQVTAANNIGLNPDLLLAANTTGGVVGKMISPQSLAIAATAVNLEGKESAIFKSVVGYSIVLLIGLCTLVFLQTNILSWMAPVVN
ncbi:L-lactate permease [Corynebacterium propinquum]|uniref:L-lactate permease n=1 Tax=Corynebacterium propinquum TaxID=43769 RepID=A0AAP4BVE3_9CORY|nr:L-lactate permease [Corynebacterium propinquum]MCG7230571.1 L-lactate permease [Corynebacterium propinquum]MCT1817757.1 L-lactate permease [Corynebacterium propinquum]MDK4252287.1 L-lactate permease [Corynebacterium propinquum]MDK4257279.1 L-lactate permease [Corynebacterium propinquum]MDK4298475.1 L-lactate permease [Corynebacterium propinquum]